MAEAAIVFISMALLIRILWLLDRAAKTSKPVSWGLLGYRSFAKPRKPEER